MKMVRRTRLLQTFLCLLFLIATGLMISFNSLNKEPKIPYKVMDTTDKDRPPKFRIVHLDLKGAPPKVDYLLYVIKLAHQAGANGLLIEYEDTFPWTGSLQNITAKNAYSREEVLTMVKRAEDLNMLVIPLVQTFGHLEFVLKLQEFRHLRELDSYPQEICPAMNESFMLVKEMIRQTMDLHPNSQYLHIGCDEVYHLGACRVCSRYEPRAVFDSHITKVARFVRKTYPGVTPIIWDDMLRKWPPMELEGAAFLELVEPMIWVYSDDIKHLVPQYSWYIYKKSFHNVWAASAFKGASGETAILPKLNHRISNNLAWLQFMQPKDTNSVMKAEDFRGIVLTGWSRYDHFAVLAELLPVSLPSLILNLALTESLNTGSQTDAVSVLKHVLKCPNYFQGLESLMVDEPHWNFGRCEFNGSRLYFDVMNYLVLKSRFDNLYKQYEESGWVSEYNQKHEYTSPQRVLEMFPEEGFAGQRLYKEIVSFKAEVYKDLLMFYDDYTAKEWIEEKLEPMERKLKNLESVFQSLILLKVWPARY